jgi:hypothetical protein
MTTTASTNRELADRAQEIAKASDGMRRRAAMCASVALGTTNSVGAARSALADLLSQPDLRKAATELLEELDGERSEQP